VRRALAVLGAAVAFATATAAGAVGPATAAGAVGPAAGAVGRAAAAAVDARVNGAFQMRGVVTAAVNVRGEYSGEQVTRRWAIQALGCLGGSACNRLLVTRNRGYVQGSFVVLHRIAPGQYRGSGAFWVPLQCLGRVYILGSRVPYTITLTVGSRRRIGSVWYATSVSATYVNPARSDSTRCPLGQAHDAARYLGRLTSRLPKPPYAIRR